MDRMTKYLDFIEKRATGQLLTPATWIRNFIRSHKDYKFDSVVTDSIAYDLMVACNEIGLGKRAAPELLGDVEIRLISATEAYVKKLESKRVNNEQVISLLERYASRKTFRGSNSGEHKRRTLGVSTRDGETEAVPAEYSI
jgi:glutamate--cysteine ligase catalytic subunit